MHSPRNSLVSRLAQELKPSFLLHCDEMLNALSFSTFDHHKVQYPTPEINFMAQGQAEHFNAMQSIHTVALNENLTSLITPTTPAGSFFVKISTPEFELVCIRSESKNWASAKHKKELALLNRSFDSTMLDLFEAAEISPSSERILIIACVSHIKPSIADTAKEAQMFFIVPNSDLTRNLITIGFEELLQAGIATVNTDELEPIVSLKKRLSDTDGFDEAATS